MYIFFRAYVIVADLMLSCSDPLIYYSSKGLLTYLDFQSFDWTFFRRVISETLYIVSTKLDVYVLFSCYSCDNYNWLNIWTSSEINWRIDSTAAYHWLSPGVLPCAEISLFFYFYLNSGFTQTNSSGKFFPDKSIWIMCSFKYSL